jgi:3-hydroxyacyl-CoA dehydrogenase
VAKKIKKVAVVSGVCDGFIGNRMFEQYTRQAFFLVQEGATVQRVDKAAEAFGFAMGPFRVVMTLALPSANAVRLSSPT